MKCSPEGWLQDELLFYRFIELDTLVLSRSQVYNDCLKGAPQWFNKKGEKIREVEIGTDGCTIFPGYHLFMMPGNIEMELSALINSITYWYEDDPSIIQSREEYYSQDGSEQNLSRKINYYKNGYPESEFSYTRVRVRQAYLWSSLHSFDYDKIFGPCRFYYDSGVVESEGERDGHLETGTWKYYKKDGTLYEKKIHHNKDSVTVIKFYPSGDTSRIYHLEYHMKKGDDRCFYESGQLKSYTHYDHFGERDTLELSWYPGGQLMESIPCCGRYNNGTYTSWYENGQKKEEVNIVEGYRSGEYRSWHSNGKLSTKGQYDEYELKVGMWYYYNKSGQFDHKTNYDKEPELPEVAEEVPMVLDASDRKEDPRLFTRKLPTADFLEKMIALKAYKHSSKLKNSGKIEVSVFIDEGGEAQYTILSTIGKKQRLVLEQIFSDHLQFESPFMMMDEAVPSVMIMEVVYYE